MSSGVLCYVCIDRSGVLPQPFYSTQSPAMASAYAGMNGCRVIGVEVPWEEEVDGYDYVLRAVAQQQRAPRTEKKGT